MSAPNKPQRVPPLADPAKAAAARKLSKGAAEMDKKKKLPSDKAPNLLVEGDILKERWHVVRKLGAGGFGQVYLAIDAVSGREVALKTEALAADKHLIKMEVAVMRAIEDRQYVPAFLGCGRTSSCNFMAMSLVGSNLADLRRMQPSQKFSIGTVGFVCREIIFALRTIHEAGALHRDVKPSNFAIGIPPHQKRIFMLDFGLARFYLTSDGHLLPPRRTAGFRGTSRYASLNAHRQKELARRDDLWSLFYMAVEMAVGELPWRRLKGKAEIEAMKEEHPPSVLCAQLPKEFLLFAEAVDRLQYGDTPDYAALAGLFDTLHRSGRSLVLDWEVHNPETASTCSSPKPVSVNPPSSKQSSSDGKRPAAGLVRTAAGLPRATTAAATADGSVAAARVADTQPPIPKQSMLARAAIPEETHPAAPQDSALAGSQPPAHVSLNPSKAYAVHESTPPPVSNIAQHAAAGEPAAAPPPPAGAAVECPLSQAAPAHSAPEVKQAARLSATHVASSPSSASASPLPPNAPALATWTQHAQRSSSLLPQDTQPQHQSTFAPSQSVFAQPMPNPLARASPPLSVNITTPAVPLAIGVPAALSYAPGAATHAARPSGRSPSPLANTPPPPRAPSMPAIVSASASSSGPPSPRALGPDADVRSRPASGLAVESTSATFASASALPSGLTYLTQASRLPSLVSPLPSDLLSPALVKSPALRLAPVPEGPTDDAPSPLFSSAATSAAGGGVFGRTTSLPLPAANAPAIHRASLLSVTPSDGLAPHRPSGSRRLSAQPSARVRRFVSPVQSNGPPSALPSPRE